METSPFSQHFVFISFKLYWITGARNFDGGGIKIEKCCDVILVMLFGDLIMLTY